MVNSSISICVGSWCWWLRVGEKRHTKGFFVKGGSVMAVHSGARRCQLHLRLARTTEKKNWWAKKGGAPTFPHLPAHLLSAVSALFFNKKKINAINDR
jgi:hypothetical protein